MSPTVLRVGGFRLYFFSREEARAHVHVQHAEGEAKIWLEPAVEVAVNHGLRPDLLGEAVSLVEEHLDDVRSAWAATSAVEVTNVSPHGFWLFIDEREMFLPFREFPWFRDASIGALSNVQRPSPHHLYWPDLDIDLAVESIDHPDRFPLISRTTGPVPGPAVSSTGTS